MTITAFLSRSPGLLNRRPGGSASLGHGPHSSIFSPTATAQSGSWGPPLLGAGFLYCTLSPTDLISNWLNFLCTELYNNFTSTLLPASVTISHSIQPVHGLGYILIFLERMHLLFTQVHFLFWLLGRGQYVTIEPRSPGPLANILTIMPMSGCHLVVWSNFNLLHRSQWITFRISSSLVLYFFCASFPHSIIIIIVITPLRVFHIRVSWWFSTGVWETVTLLKFPELFS